MTFNFLPIPPEKILPTVLIIIDIMAGIVYLTQANYRKAIYWLSAAVLTAAVTY
jgi:hypothetical protein